MTGSLGLVVSAVLACAPQVVLVDSDSAASSTGFTATSTTTTASGTTGEVTTTGDGTPTTGDGATAPTSTMGALVCEPPVGEPGALASLLQATGAGKQTLQAVRVDGAGNTYVAGDFTSELNFAGATTTLAGDLAAPFVAKFDCAGELSWLSVGEPEAGATGNARALAVTDEVVFVGGSVTGTLGFPSGTIAGGPGGAFVARFEAASGALVAGHVLAEGATAVHALALTDSSIHAAGSCIDPDAPETFGILHAELDLELEAAAPRCLYSPAVPPPAMGQARVTTSARAVAVAEDGDVILAGQITGPLDNGAAPVVSGDADGFVARLQSPLAAGPALFDDGWITTLGDTERRDRVNGMALADNGDVIVVGLGHGKFFPQDPPGCEDTSGDLYTAFVTRLAAADGSCVAHEMLESNAMQSTEAHAVAVRGQNVYVLGQFGRSLGVAGESIAEEADAPFGIRMFLLGLDEDLRLETHFYSEQTAQDVCSGNEEARALGYDLAAGEDVVMAVADACGDGVQLAGTPILDSDAFLAGFVPAP